MKEELYELLRDLLTPLELRFLKEVIAFTNNKLRSGDKCYSSDDEPVSPNVKPNVRPKIAVLEENVISIVKRLKKGTSARQRFVRTHPKWKENRENCIAELHKIAESIKSDRFNCNVSKLVGYCTSAVGGAVSLVSAILIPFTLGLTTPLAIAGGVLTAAGFGTAVGTSITEIILLKSKVEKAKILLENDKENFECMSEWLEHASDLQEALSKVLDIDIVKDITEQVANFVRETKTIMIQSHRITAIERGINHIIKQHFPQLTPYFGEIVDVISIIANLVAVFLVLQNTKNRLIFDCELLTIKSILGVGSLVARSFNILNLSKALAANAAVGRNLSKAIARGAVAVVGIALDVVGIVYTSVDIHNGSFSPEAEKIAEAACSLREEADILERVYISISPRTAYVLKSF